MHGNIKVIVEVFPVPENITHNMDAVLNFEIAKISVEGVTNRFTQKLIDPDLNYFFKNYTVPKIGKMIRIEHSRSMTQKNIFGTLMEKMPGIKLSWYYDKDVIQTDTWLKKASNQAFIRWKHISIKRDLLLSRIL